MAEIVPFKGVFYNTQKVEIDRVVGPPYDVLNADEQSALYGESPFNFVRIILFSLYFDKKDRIFHFS